MKRNIVTFAVASALSWFLLGCSKTPSSGKRYLVKGSAPQSDYWARTPDAGWRCTVRRLASRGVLVEGVFTVTEKPGTREFEAALEEISNGADEIGGGFGESSQIVSAIDDASQKIVDAVEETKGR